MAGTLMGSVAHALVEHVVPAISRARPHSWSTHQSAFNADLPYQHSWQSSS